MTTKTKAAGAKGPGDPCPNCGTELVSHTPVQKARMTPQGMEAPLPPSEGIAECPRCKYVLTEAVEAEDKGKGK